MIDDKAVAGHTDTDIKEFDTKIEFQLPEEYRNKAFRLGLIFDDVVYLENYKSTIVPDITTRNPYQPNSIPIAYVKSHNNPIL